MNVNSSNSIAFKADTFLRQANITFEVARNAQAKAQRVYSLVTEALMRQKVDVDIIQNKDMVEEFLKTLTHDQSEIDQVMVFFIFSPLADISESHQTC